MKNRTTIFSLFLMVLTFAQPTLSYGITADELHTSALMSGSLVRVETDTEVFEGFYQRHNAKSLSIRTPTGTRSIFLENIKSIQRGEIEWGRNTLIGGALGAATGVVTGLGLAVLGIFRGEVILGTTALGGLLGAASGTLTAPMLLQWRQIAGSPTYRRPLYKDRVKTGSASLHIGRSQFWAPEPFAHNKNSYALNLGFPDLAPHISLNIPFFFTEFDQSEKLSKTLVVEETVFSFGPDVRVSTALGSFVEPFVGAGLKYISSRPPIGGRQRTLGVQVSGGVRFRSLTSPVFFELGGQYLLGVLKLQGDRLFRISEFNGGVGVLW